MVKSFWEMVVYRPSAVCNFIRENPARCEFKMSATTAKHIQNLKGTNEIPEAPLVPNSTGLPTLTNGKVPIASRYLKAPDGSWQRGFITKSNNEYTIPGVIT